MKKYQFKTNIKCSGCVAAVTPHLDAARDIHQWNVDTNHPDKVLSVETDHLPEEEVKAIIQKAGYKAESLQQ